MRASSGFTPLLPVTPIGAQRPTGNIDCARAYLRVLPEFVPCFLGECVHVPTEASHIDATPFLGLYHTLGKKKILATKSCFDGDVNFSSFFFFFLLMNQK